jgi:hypothetical protein
MRVSEFADAEQVADPQHGYVGCGTCGVVAQALEDEPLGNDWHALGEWSQEHAATHEPTAAEGR